MKVFIHKYSLTNGKIMEVDATEGTTPGWIRYDGGGFTNYVPRSVWETTRELAIQKAEVAREKKLKSLRAQIKKLEGLVFQ